MSDNLFTIRVNINKAVLTAFVRSIVEKKVQAQIDSAVSDATDKHIDEFVRDKINTVMSSAVIQTMLHQLAGDAIASRTTPERIEKIINKRRPEATKYEN